MILRTIYWEFRHHLFEHDCNCFLLSSPTSIEFTIAHVNKHLPCKGSLKLIGNLPPVVVGEKLTPPPAPKRKQQNTSTLAPIVTSPFRPCIWRHWTKLQGEEAHAERGTKSKRKQTKLGTKTVKQLDRNECSSTVTKNTESSIKTLQQNGKNCIRNVQLTGQKHCSGRKANCSRGKAQPAGTSQSCRKSSRREQPGSEGQAQVWRGVSPVTPLTDLHGQDLRSSEAHEDPEGL